MYSCTQVELNNLSNFSNSAPFLTSVYLQVDRCRKDKLLLIYKNVFLILLIFFNIKELD